LTKREKFSTAPRGLEERVETMPSKILARVCQSQLTSGAITNRPFAVSWSTGGTARLGVLACRRVRCCENMPKRLLLFDTLVRYSCSINGPYVVKGSNRLELDSKGSTTCLRRESREEQGGDGQVFMTPPDPATDLPQTLHNPATDLPQTLPNPVR